MQFVVVERSRNLPDGYEGCYLVPDGWNDYGFLTLYELGIKRRGHRPQPVGQVRIGHVDMGSGNRGEELCRTEELLPREFDSLSPGFFSLGLRDTYYEALNTRDDDIKVAILTALHDVAYAYRTEVVDRISELLVFQKSLMRDVRHPRAELERLHLIARGRDRVVDFQWDYVPPLPGGSEYEPPTLSFRASPTSLPPSNVHALIGRNGVGKTSMMRAMADGVASGDIEVTQLADRSAQITPNVVLVSFSAFDDLLHRTDDPAGFAYIGLRDGDELQRLKTREDLSDEFARSLATARIGARRSRWERILATLSYPESGFLDDYVGDLDALLSEGSDLRFKAAAVRLFAPLSSGHKIALLTLTRLVQEVTERTVVFMDEPEAHLQPPLLSAFIRALSDFLSDVNGMAVVATHSPVVLQEVPRSCVYKLRRYGNVLTSERPLMETYGENISALTHEAFGLESAATGFYAALAKEVDEGRSYQEILEDFESLGSEARGLLRVLTSRRDGRAS
ncbi:AAA family ATPase [[Kitasatospora] papulosa]|uniref:AAA family ATPase n=1 Tax=[Kitasatospora] papulosa TaxID=1464011 RepID=UPI002E120706|nr:AAA family ATPase [[Kitasatospora] papulosa]WSI15490.1 AAA family ATPase [[Kitasatospora] papulosa]